MVHGSHPIRPTVRRGYAKATVAQCLEQATKNTKKGRHLKIEHASKLLGLVNPETVQKRCPHCMRIPVIVIAQSGMVIIQS